jgi:protein-tyrosine phosphatase
MIDLHSHVLPGIDDGARDVAGSIEVLRAAVADGVSTIAATPHVRDDWPTRPEQMQTGLAAVQGLVDGIEVLPGGELDLRFAAALDDETLAAFGLGGNPRLLLLETPWSGWPLDMEELVFSFAVRGFRILLAHPERNPDVQERPEIVRPLVDAGVAVQITAVSLTGEFGKRARDTARALLEDDCAHVLASDAHAPAVRGTRLGAAVETLGDDALGRWLTHDVPAALLAGDSLPPRPAKRRTMRLPWR